MVSSIPFFAILLLFASCVFALKPEPIQRFPKSIRRNPLQKRAPEDDLCAEGEEWNERRCNGAVNELAWIDSCWDPAADEWVDREGACDGGFMCTDTEDDDGDLVIECVENPGQVINPGADEPQHVGAGGFVLDDDQEDEEEEDADEGWAGEVINEPAQPDQPQAHLQRHTIRYMGKTVLRAAFSAALLSKAKNSILPPTGPIAVTVGNLKKQLCVWSPKHRYCEPKHHVTLWKGDRIDITYSISGNQAGFLVYTAVGPKVHNLRKRYEGIDLIA